MKTLTRARYLVTAVCGYALYLGGHLAFGALIVPLLLPLFPFPRLRRRLFLMVFNGFVRFLTRAYLPALGIYRIAELPHTEAPATPAIYVANHRSRIDGPLLLGLIQDAGVVIKTAYGRNPLFAGFVRHLDFISVNPGSLASLASAGKRAAELFSRKKNLLVFPEGTRAAGGRMLPFREFAFRLAQDRGLPVVPVVVHTSLPFMTRRRGSMLPGRRFDVRVRFLAPQTPRPDERTGDFTGRIEQMIARELREMDRGTVWESL